MFYLFVMGKIKKVIPVKLISSVIYSREDILENVFNELNKKIGEIELITDRFLFNHTNYYSKEMGEKLYRKFIIFKGLFNRENLAQIKIDTNTIEESFTIDDNRQVNLDPGYLTLENFILFTTKNYTHRIYLEKGIYADLTLIFENKQFNNLPWTYPDYASTEIKNLLKEIREKYKNELKKEGWLNENI